MTDFSSNEIAEPRQQAVGGLRPLGAGTISIIVFFACWALWLCIEYVAFGHRSFVHVHDNGDAILPATLRLVSGHGGGFSRWALEFMCGTDRLAAPTSTPFDLLVFSMFRGWLAYGLLMILQRFLAGYFSYRVCREVLNLGHTASLFCGLAYSLFRQPSLNEELHGFQLYDGLALPGLPLLIFSLSKIGPTTRIYGIATSLLLGVALGLTSTYALAVFVFAGLAFWFAFVTPRRDLAFWMCFLALFVGWAGASAPSVIAGALNARDSQRLSWNYFTPWLASPDWRTVSGIVTDNIVLLMIVVTGMSLARRRSRRLTWLLVGVVAFYVPLLLYPPFRALFHQYLGPFAGIQGDRFFQLVPFFLCVAAATSLDIVHRRLNDVATTKTGYARSSISSLAFIPALFIVGQSAVVKVASGQQLIWGNGFQSLYENPELVSLSKSMESQPPYRIVTISADGLNPGFMWAYGFETADGYLNVYPNSYKQFWSSVIAPLLQRDAHWREYFSNWGNRVYLFTPLGDDPSDLDFGAYYRLNLLSLANVRYVVSPVELHADGLVYVPPATPNRWLAWQHQSMRRRFLDVLTGSQPPRLVFIYENRLALPRFFVASAGTPPPGSTVLDEMERADMATLRSSALMSPDDLPSQPSSNQCLKGTVRVSSYSADAIHLTVEAPGQCVLVATNTYSAGWHASLDGVQTPVIRVDHTFQGVLVPTGQHELSLRYEPAGPGGLLR